MNGQQYREKLLVHAKLRGYTRTRRKGNNWIFTAASGARVTVEFEPGITEKSGYLRYAKIRLTAAQNEAQGRWSDDLALRLRSEYGDKEQQKPSRSRTQNQYSKLLPDCFARHGEALPGEDRSFGGNTFRLEHLPRGSWFRNLRSMLPVYQWKILGIYIRERAGHRCEICNTTGQLDAHECWVFDEPTKTQRLVRIMCICKACHLGMHLGLASTKGLRGAIEQHIMTITGWSKEELNDHVGRNASLPTRVTDWKVDVGIVAKCGATILDSARTVAARERSLAREQQGRSIALEHAGSRRSDLSVEIGRGMVAIVDYDRINSIGGTPLSDDIMTPYVATMPTNIPANITKIPLSLFVKAHNNPVVVPNERQLGDMLNDPVVPKRLIVRRSWIDEETVERCLKDAVLFWCK